MKIINILFCLFLLLLNSCNSNDNDTLKNNAQQTKSRKKRDLSQEELPQQEKITLTSDEEKIFTSLVTAFKYTVEKLSGDTNGCNNENKNKCTGFFDWLSSTDTQKQKELAQAFTTAYNFLESKRQSKAQNETFDTYIKGAIDCKNNNNNNNNKYGNGSNDIEQYFRGVAGSIFTDKNDKDEIYKCLKDELLNDTTGHYAGLTTNWQN
ncbi:Mlp family lipoprotein [Borreliella burgdorferi]|uniref:Mlp family lipoprotein n=1 Tax=Borreliella burgdorferi TaxID=139 RepID=UPI0026FDAA21|nr:Mlp family lipoprotein [Borreliella burgdorferi]MDO7273080.1 Mlp family lipoprotein [Borreliella burgdorferi]